MKGVLLLVPIVFMLQGCGTFCHIYDNGIRITGQNNIQNELQNKIDCEAKTIYPSPQYVDGQCIWMGIPQDIGG